MSKAKILLFMEIDSAASFADAELDSVAIHFPDFSSEYKYLAFVDTEPKEHEILAFCSKNKTEWAICLGAKRNGITLDLLAMSESLRIQALENDSRRNI